MNWEREFTPEEVEQLAADPFAMLRQALRAAWVMSDDGELHEITDAITPREPTMLTGDMPDIS